MQVAIVRTMKRWMGLLLLAVAVAVASAAESNGYRGSKPEVRKEIVRVIQAQLEAFRKQEAAKAYGYAATALRAQMPLEVFTAIVRESYPEIWANTRAEAGIVRDDGTRAKVTVQVYSKPGDAVYDFTLAKEEAGWRIFGVLRHAPRKGGTL